MKKIPKKNYIIVGIICSITIIVVSYFAFWYTENKIYDENNSIMSGYLLELGEDEISVNLTNYVLDNPDTILYISYGNDSNVKNFEKDFKNYIEKNNIKSLFVYIDLNRIEDKKFISNFKDNFFSDSLKNKNIKINKQPNLFIFNSGKVESVLYNVKQDISVSDVEIYLKREGVISND